MLVHHAPEYCVLCPFGTGVRPEQFAPPPGYQVARLFAAGWKSPDGVDFYVVVLQKLNAR